jgi:hypothetical protein
MVRDLGTMHEVMGSNFNPQLHCKPKKKLSRSIERLSHLYTKKPLHNTLFGKETFGLLDNRRDEIREQIIIVL